jgi:hypothetical protein
MLFYTCGRCGKNIDKSSRVCPNCGARLSVKCRNCGFSGAREDYIGGVCPRCNNFQDKVQNSRYCKACGRPFVGNEWACPSCGHIDWERVYLMAGLAVACIVLGLYILPFPSLIAWLMIGIGAVSFIMAASRVGSTLGISKSPLLAISILIIAWLVLSGVTMHKKGHYLHVFAETPTPIPSMTASLPPTITPVPTEAPPASPTPVITPTPSGKATIQRIQVNVRAAPNTGANIVAVVNMNDQVSVFGRSPDGGWLLIATGSGITGWISAPLVTMDKPLNTIQVVTPSSPR